MNKRPERRLSGRALCVQPPSGARPTDVGRGVIVSYEPNPMSAQYPTDGRRYRGSKVEDFGGVIADDYSGLLVLPVHFCALQKIFEKCMLLKMTTKSQRARGWCFTSFDLDAPQYPPCAQYLCYQHEMCPSSGRPHWQSFIYFTNPKTFSGVQKLFPKAHIEPSRGTPEQCRTYCSKSDSSIPDTFREYGTLPQQGSRTDLHSVIEAIRTGIDWFNVLLDYPEVASRHIKYLKELYLSMNTPKGYKPRKLIIISGPPGCGKTSLVYSLHDSVYDYDWHNKWFDGYDRQDCLLIDEFDPFQFDSNLFKKLADGHPLRKEVKGGHVNIHAHYVYVVTNCPPELIRTWITHTPGIERRITFWMNCYDDAPDELCPPGHPYFEKNKKILENISIQNGLSSKDISQDLSSSSRGEIPFPQSSSSHEHGTENHLSSSREEGS